MENKHKGLLNILFGKLNKINNQLKDFVNMYEKYSEEIENNYNVSSQLDNERTIADWFSDKLIKLIEKSIAPVPMKLTEHYIKTPSIFKKNGKEKTEYKKSIEGLKHKQDEWKRWMTIDCTFKLEYKNEIYYIFVEYKMNRTKKIIPELATDYVKHKFYTFSNKFEANTIFLFFKFDYDENNKNNIVLYYKNIKEIPDNTNWDESLNEGSIFYNINSKKHNDNNINKIYDAYKTLSNISEKTKTIPIDTFNILKNNIFYKNKDCFKNKVAYSNNIRLCLNIFEYVYKKFIKDKEKLVFIFKNLISKIDTDLNLETINESSLEMFFNTGKLNEVLIEKIIQSTAKHLWNKEKQDTKNQFDKTRGTVDIKKMTSLYIISLVYTYVKIFLKEEFKLNVQDKKIKKIMEQIKDRNIYLINKTIKDYEKHRDNFEGLVFVLCYFIVNLWNVIGIKDNEEWELSDNFYTQKNINDILKIISKYDKNDNINDVNTFFNKINQVVIKIVSGIK
ncbi:hypothetical protein O7983_000437 [Mycoplasmopsis felis]|uniref:hypothetical protein n=1 Tax=Mycoplasmopsis felis TaxID=33923 RepID=UPI003A4E1469